MSEIIRVRTNGRLAAILGLDTPTQRRLPTPAHAALHGWSIVYAEDDAGLVYGREVEGRIIRVGGANSIGVRLLLDVLGTGDEHGDGLRAALLRTMDSTGRIA